MTDTKIKREQSLKSKNFSKKKTFSTIFMNVLAAVMMFSTTARNSGEPQDDIGGGTVTVRTELIIGQTVT